MMRDQLSCVFGEEARFGISRMRQQAEGTRRIENKDNSTSRYFADGWVLHSRQTYASKLHSWQTYASIQRIEGRCLVMGLLWF
jgi:hypothetical protein